MKIETLKLPNTIQGTRDIIQRHTDEFGVFFDYDRICEYMFYFATEHNKALKHVRELAGKPYYLTTDRDETINILVNRFGVDKTLLMDRNGKFTTDKKVIEQVKNYYSALGGPLIEFIDEYLHACSLRVALSSYKSYKDLPMCRTLDRDNHRMVVAHPTWNILSTSRLSAKDPGIQTIDRNRGDIITAPKGYQLVRSDSGQIEPRIMWSYFLKDPLMKNLIIAYNDAYFAYYDFVTMSPEREARLREDFSKNFVKTEITDSMKEGRQQMKRISLAAGYGSSLPANGGFDQNLGRLYTARIVNHPLRKELEAKIRSDVYSGTQTFYGAFGSPVTPDETDKYTKDGSGWAEHLIRCGINNPIQTTASELMIFAVNRAENILRSKGHNSHICFYKHDEGCFYLNEDAGDMDLAEELGACQSYEVTDWIPIYSEMEIGRKEPHNDALRLL